MVALPLISFCAALYPLPMRKDGVFMDLNEFVVLFCLGVVLRCWPVAAVKEYASQNDLSIYSRCFERVIL